MPPPPHHHDSHLHLLLPHPLENIQEEDSAMILPPLSHPQPSFLAPDAPHGPMEFLSRSWSASALNVANALSSSKPSNSPPPHPLPPLADGDGDGDGDAPLSVPFAFPSSITAHLVMERILTHHSDLVPASKKKSHNNTSANLIASCPGSPPWQGDELMFCRSFSAVRNPLKEVSLRRWLKDMKERKKEMNRAHNAQVHAAVSVAGVAAAVAAIAAATATSATDDNQGKTSMAVASAAALVAAQCAEVAETIGADRDHVSSVISSAVNVKVPGDVMTLTAAAATALRGAAVLNARILKDSESSAAYIPCDRSHNTLISSSRESPSDDSESECGNLGFLHRGCEFLKRTRKGDIHWRIVSVYLDKSSQVIVKSQSKYMGAAIVKSKKRLVLGVFGEIPSWNRGVDGEERRWLFGIKTDQGVMELECKNEAQRRLWTEGISHLLSMSKHQKQT